VSARRIIVELTEPQIHALIRAAGDWEDQHDPDGVAAEDYIHPDDRRRVAVVRRARQALMDAVYPSRLPMIPEHPLNRVSG
jgi:hypothetical protein